MKTLLKKTTVIIPLICVIVLSSCKKDEPTPEPIIEGGNVTVVFNHKWGSSAVDFVTKSNITHPTTGDVLNFSTFMYYVSNIQLKNEDGNWWSHPESYFLIDLTTPATTNLNLTNVPAGNYTDIKYVFGVDSIRNVSGAQTGALSVAHGMFWTWSTGYIMLKAEGTYTNGTSGSFSYHLGGFQGANSVVIQKLNTFNGEKLTVNKDKTVSAYLNVFPDKLFETIGSATNISSISSPGTNAKTMATDFCTSFAFDHLAN